MSDQPKRIRLTMGAGRGCLEVGGVDLSNSARAVDLHFKAGGLPEVTVVLSVLEGEIEGEASVRLPEETRAALIALGWTPPQD